MKNVWPFAGLTSDINHVFQQEVDHCLTASHTCSERRYQVHIWGISMGSEHKFQRWGKSQIKGLNWVLISETHSKLFRTFSVWMTTLLTTLKHFLRYWSTSKDPKMAYLKTCSLSFLILIAFLVETDAGEWMWNKLLSRMCYWFTSMLFFGHAVKR